MRMFWAFGSLIGRKSAVMAQNTTSTSQPTAAQKKTRGRFFFAAGIEMPTVCGSAAIAPPAVSDSGSVGRSGFWGESRSGCACATADPGVEDGVEQVDGEVREHRSEGEEQHDALHHHEVALGDRLEEEAAHAGKSEELLDDDGAADQRADLEADDRQQRERGGA